MDDSTKLFVRARLNLCSARHAMRKKEERLRTLRMCVSGNEPELFLQTITGVKIAICPKQVSLNNRVMELLGVDILSNGIYHARNFYYIDVEKHDASKPFALQTKPLDRFKTFSEQGVPFGALIEYTTTMEKQHKFSNAFAKKTVRPKTLSEVEAQRVAATLRSRVLQTQIERAESRIKRLKKRKRMHTSD